MKTRLRPERFRSMEIECGVFRAFKLLQSEAEGQRVCVHQQHDEARRRSQIARGAGACAAVVADNQASLESTGEETEGKL